MVSGIDLDKKWNDYSSDTLFLWNGSVVFRISEGTGENLWEEDIRQGYKDYWVTDWAGTDVGDSGIWLEKECISVIDYTIQGVIDRLKECDLWEDNWKVIDEDIGEQLLEQFEKIWNVNLELKALQNMIMEG